MLIGSVCAFALFTLLGQEPTAGVPPQAGVTVPAKQVGSEASKPLDGPARLLPADGSAAQLAPLAGRRSPDGGPDLVEVGKTYRFVLTNAACREVRGRVVGPVENNWVRVEVSTGDAPVTARVNLTAVAVIVPERDEK